VFGSRAVASPARIDVPCAGPGSRSPHPEHKRRGSGPSARRAAVRGAFRRAGRGAGRRRGGWPAKPLRRHARRSLILDFDGLSLPPTSSELAGKQPNTNVSVECIVEILPKTFASIENVRGLQLFPLPMANGGGGHRIWFDRSGAEWKWPAIDGSFPPSGYSCEVTDYKTVPPFDFSMLLELTFWKLPTCSANQAQKARRNYITAGLADRDPKT
jgi:hypothetical protein